jgi:hypothetical protein
MFCGGCARVIRRPSAAAKMQSEHTMPIDVITDLVP